MLVDEWTPETSPEVRALRAAGVSVRCVADLVLERSPVPVLGVTGSAGKTTTATLAAALLRAAGLPVDTAEGRAANLWPDERQLERVPGLTPPAWVVAELTSTHLCYMRRSPHVAVVTCLWPDHLELHGSLRAYREAKETIVRHQRSEDWVVLPADDDAVIPFAALTPGRAVWFGERALRESNSPLPGVFVEDGLVVARWEGEEHGVADAAALPVGGRMARNALAACAAALCAGVPPEALADGLAAATLPPHRLRRVGTFAGTPVFDDGMAATPAKTEAALEGFADASIVLIAGGEPAVGGLAVHDTPEERLLLERACALARRKARTVVLFGRAAPLLAPLLPGERAPGLDDAVALALDAASGAAAVLFSPMFPVSLADRERFPSLVRTRDGQGP